MFCNLLFSSFFLTAVGDTLNNGNDDGSWSGPARKLVQVVQLYIPVPFQCFYVFFIFEFMHFRALSATPLPYPR
jgi:hypothetical protein